MEWPGDGSWAITEIAVGEVDALWCFGIFILIEVIKVLTDPAQATKRTILGDGTITRINVQFWERLVYLYRGSSCHCRSPSPCSTRSLGSILLNAFSTSLFQLLKATMAHSRAPTIYSAMH